MTAGDPDTFDENLAKAEAPVKISQRRRLR
jgi:hypothetical protein